jgi:hypothetical protein
VIAEAYDNPIPGYDTPTSTNLRLWDALPEHEFNLDAFNAGEYEKATVEANRAHAIAAVLYPNDSTPEGKELRLKQQFFFVSASLQVGRCDRRGRGRERGSVGTGERAGGWRQAVEGEREGLGVCGVAGAVDQAVQGVTANRDMLCGWWAQVLAVQPASQPARESNGAPSLWLLLS